MPIADFEALIARTRVALVAKPHLVLLYNPKSLGISLGGISTSSHDFYLRLHLVGSTTHPIDRAFSGYDSSDAQDQTLPMRLATAPIDALLASLPLAPQPTITADDKALFSRRFLATMSDAPKQYWWWVEERFVALAPRFGTIDIVPLLAKIATWPSGSSSDRIRPVALEAIATITGWDPRVDEHGKTRSTEEAARIAVKECDVALR